jgi:hypothetical protein
MNSLQAFLVCAKCIKTQFEAAYSCSVSAAGKILLAAAQKRCNVLLFNKLRQISS